MGTLTTFGVLATLAAACAFGCGLDVVGTEREDVTSGGSAPGTGRSSSPSELPQTPSDTPAEPPPANDTPSAPPPPAADLATVLSPWHPSMMLTYQRPIDWTIGALEPTTVIRYTTDGSTPVASSRSATGKVTLAALPGGTVIKWMAGDAGPVHSFTVNVKSDLDASTHAIVENVRFDLSGGPVVRVKPETILNGKAAAVVWNGTSSCPNCINQITIGITTAAACIVSVNPQTYPGAGGRDLVFKLAAPKMPGVYKVKSGFTQQYKCNPDAIGGNLSETEVGTIIVE